MKLVTLVGMKVTVAVLVPFSSQIAAASFEGREGDFLVLSQVLPTWDQHRTWGFQEATEPIVSVEGLCFQ